jgi:hypothetical protein
MQRTLDDASARHACAWGAIGGVKVLGNVLPGAYWTENQYNTT